VPDPSEAWSRAESGDHQGRAVIACAALAFVVMEEEEPELAGYPEISFSGPENADEAAYEVVSAEDEDSYEQEYDTDRNFPRHW